MKIQINKNPVTNVPVIYDCNDNCISCPVPRRGNRINPSFEKITENIDQILSYSKHISFNGGEPTIRKDLFQILEYAQKKGASEIALLTNSEALYNEKLVKKLARIKGLKIVTTIYGGSSLIHNAITRTPNSFEYKIRGLKNLVNYHIPIELRILLHKMNYKHFNEMAKFIIDNFKPNNFGSIIIMNPKLTERACEYQKVVAEKLTNISQVLEKPIEILLKKGFKVGLYHFPHCILPNKLWGLSRGITADEAEVIFAPNCANCIKKQECSRIWKSYIDIFGDAEFKSINKKLNLEEFKKLKFLKSFSDEEWRLNGHIIKKVDLFRNFFNKILDLVQKGNYLELGCGTGIICRYLTKFSDNKIIPHGIDLKQDLISRARKNNPGFENNFIELDYLKIEPQKISKFENINIFMGKNNDDWLKIADFIEKIGPQIKSDARLIITAYDFNLNYPNQIMIDFADNMSKKFEINKINEHIALLKKRNEINKITQ